jgi:hypothetical protein
MAIISDYEEDSEDVETIVRANLQDVDNGYEDEEEDYPPDPYSSSRPSDATSCERPYDEVLGYLLREHQQQPLDLLSTVIEFLFRETGIASQEGVDVRVSEMLSAAKRRRVDIDDIEDVYGGPDKIAKLDEIFDNPEQEAQKQHVSLSESTHDSSPISECSKNSFQDKETVIITPSEYPAADICEENSESSVAGKNVVNVNDDDDDENFYEARETAVITPADEVPLTSNLAFEPEATTEMHPLPEEEKGETKAMEPKDLDPNAGNGADLENYSWTQTLYDTTLHIPVPIGTKAKSIICDIQPRYLKVGLKGQAPLLEGDLNKPVKPSECFWNVEDGKLLAIHLQKHYTMDWWHIVLEGEAEIDVTKVNLPNASLSDLHPDTRRHIEHVMFDEQQAIKELPNRDEEHKDDTLRKFMSGGLELYA